MSSNQQGPGGMTPAKYVTIFGMVAVLLIAVVLIVGHQINSGDSHTPIGTDIGEDTTSDTAPDDTTTEPAPSDDGLPYHFDGHGANVSQAMFGKQWPLTVKSGRVNCVPLTSSRLMVVFTANNNVRYALNGTARDQEAAFGFKEVAPIWADDPANPGAKKDISVLIDVCAPLQP